MNNKIIGIAYVLGDDVDTDQIIPAHHLVYNLDDEKERKLYGRFALSGIPKQHAGLPCGFIPFVPVSKDESPYSIVIAGKNFGCGSSREHAPVALQMAGIKAMIANSYARIFYRNTIDGGYLMPLECENDLTVEVRTTDKLELDLNEKWIVNHRTDKKFSLKPLGSAEDIVNAGGLFKYAHQMGIVQKA